MKVILLDNIRGVGHVGDIKDVNDGYARNFLLPKKLAKAATQGIIKDVASLKDKKLKLIELARAQAQQLAGTMEGTTVTLTAKANEQGTLFAAIEPKAIAQALSEKLNITIDPQQITLSEHIKSVGDHTVTIQLTDDVSVQATVTISLV